MGKKLSYTQNSHNNQNNVTSEKQVSNMPKLRLRVIRWENSTLSR